MATGTYSCPPFPLGVTFPMMSIPHAEKVHGEVKAWRMEGGKCCRFPWIWHCRHLRTYSLQSCSMVDQKYPNLTIFLASALLFIWVPQTPAWTSSITVLSSTLSRHSRWTPICVRLYSFPPVRMYRTESNRIARCYRVEPLLHGRLLKVVKMTF